MRYLREREKSIGITGIPAKTRTEHLHNTILDCYHYSNLVSLMTYLPGRPVRQGLPPSTSQTKIIFTAKICAVFLQNPVCSIFVYCLTTLQDRSENGKVGHYLLKTT